MHDESLPRTSREGRCGRGPRAGAARDSRFAIRYSPPTGRRPRDIEGRAETSDLFGLAEAQGIIASRWVEDLPSGNFGRTLAVVLDPEGEKLQLGLFHDVGPDVQLEALEELDD